VVEGVLHRYLTGCSTRARASHRTLLLGCTLPGVAPLIARMLGAGVTIVDSGDHRRCAAASTRCREVMRSVDDRDRASARDRRPSGSRASVRPSSAEARGDVEIVDLATSPPVLRS
jgi:hypothetical protein